MAPKKATSAKKVTAKSPSSARKSIAKTPKDLKKETTAPMLKKVAPKKGSGTSSASTVASHSLPGAKYATSIYPSKVTNNYWLIKSEPFKWSWDQQCKKQQEHWDGVRNYQANHNMKTMKIGDLAFFYHSNEGKEIVGVVRCVKEHYPDHTDDTGRGFGMVDFSAVAAVPRPVSLAAIKVTASLKDMALVRQGRLSVCPVTPKEWDIICKMGGLN